LQRQSVEVFSLSFPYIASMEIEDEKSNQFFSRVPTLKAREARHQKACS